MDVPHLPNHVALIFADMIDGGVFSFDLFRQPGIIRHLDKKQQANILCKILEILQSRYVRPAFLSLCRSFFRTFCCIAFLASSKCFSTGTTISVLDVFQEADRVVGMLREQNFDVANFVSDDKIVADYCSRCNVADIVSC